MVQGMPFGAGLQQCGHYLLGTWARFLMCRGSAKNFKIAIMGTGDDIGSALVFPTQRPALHRGDDAIRLNDFSLVSVANLRKHCLIRLGCQWLVLMHNLFWPLPE